MDEDFFILENIHERTNALVRNDYDRKVVCCRAGISQVVEHENVTECLIVTLQLAALNDEKYCLEDQHHIGTLVFLFGGTGGLPYIGLTILILSEVGQNKLNPSPPLLGPDPSPLEKC